MAVGPPQSLYDVTTLNRVGAIAKKIGIEWGGTWTNAIDRPHFEVKPTWLMPKGCKLEGQLIVPSNSKMKVQLIVEDKKEEIKVTNSNWNPGSPAMKTEVEKFIAKAVKDEIILESHLKDLQSGAMTSDRLLGLYITIQQRRSK
ncbi:M15 family metallopeptidase [Lysinibacillus sphaericus]|uniref:M15 family metallopeptidase n=1 Tax=Lysinibacillus sphaericus TaxID=1421 RepID=UPI003CFDC5FE